MRPRIDARDLRERSSAARELLRSCSLCPRRCGVDRLAGEEGYCGAGASLEVASVVVHGGEEPVLTGSVGVGNVFLAHCNLRCVFCQNHRISQTPDRFPMTPGALAVELHRLQEAGCPTLGFVSPSHYVPQILEALALAADMGVDRPLIYNSNGYDSVEMLQIIEGVFDIFLPDFKYGSDEEALLYSDAPGYRGIALAAIREMFRQAGPVEVGAAGHAVKGVLVRHLVLPNDLARTREVLATIAREISPLVSVSLMSQYNPVHEAWSHPLLARRLREREYATAVEAMEEAGLTRGWVQDPQSSPDEYLPDFDRQNPFEPPSQVEET